MKDKKASNKLEAYIIAKGKNGGLPDFKKYGEGAPFDHSTYPSGIIAHVKNFEISILYAPSLNEELREWLRTFYQLLLEWRGRTIQANKKLPAYEDFAHSMCLAILPQIITHSTGFSRYIAEYSLENIFHQIKEINKPIDQSVDEIKIELTKGVAEGIVKRNLASSKQIIEKFTPKQLETISTAVEELNPQKASPALAVKEDIDKHIAQNLVALAIKDINNIFERQAGDLKEFQQINDPESAETRAIRHTAAIAKQKIIECMSSFLDKNDFIHYCETIDAHARAVILKNSLEMNPDQDPILLQTQALDRLNSISSHLDEKSYKEHRDFIIGVTVPLNILMDKFTHSEEDLFIPAFLAKLAIIARPILDKPTVEEDKSEITAELIQARLMKTYQALLPALDSKLFQQWHRITTRINKKIQQGYICPNSIETTALIGWNAAFELSMQEPYKKALTAAITEFKEALKSVQDSTMVHAIAANIKLRLFEHEFSLQGKGADYQEKCEQINKLGLEKIKEINAASKTAVAISTNPCRFQQKQTIAPSTTHTHQAAAKNVKSPHAP